MDNEELIRLLNAVDEYENISDFHVTDFTKKNLKSLLISGVNPRSDSFISNFPDEYHLYRQALHMIGRLE